MYKIIIQEVYCISTKELMEKLGLVNKEMTSISWRNDIVKIVVENK